MKRESLKLYAWQWYALDRLAINSQSTAQRGPRIGKYSWRALMRRIADGELVLLANGKPVNRGLYYVLGTLWLLF